MENICCSTQYWQQQPLTCYEHLLPEIIQDGFALESSLTSIHFTAERRKVLGSYNR